MTSISLQSAAVKRWSACFNALGVPYTQGLFLGGLAGFDLPTMKSWAVVVNSTGPTATEEANIKELSHFRPVAVLIGPPPRLLMAYAKAQALRVYGELIGERFRQALRDGLNAEVRPLLVLLREAVASYRHRRGDQAAEEWAVHRWLQFVETLHSWGIFHLGFEGIDLAGLPPSTVALAKEAVHWYGVWRLGQEKSARESFLRAALALDYRRAILAR